MNEKEKRIFFGLIKTAVLGVPLSENNKAEFCEEMLPEFYSLSKKHTISHLIALGLELSGLTNDENEFYKKFQKQKLSALYRQERINYHFEKQCEVLEGNKIPFMTLKGSVIKEFYPESWMRTSSDIDILVKEKDLKRAENTLKEQLSYTGEKKGHYHNVSLFSADGVHLELHFSIKEAMKNIDALLQKVWDYAEKKEGKGFQFRQTNEFLMFHIIAHMYYHFMSGGCGIKSIIDLMLLEEKLPFNRAEVLKMCEQCEIDKFYTALLKLANVWFLGEGHTELTLFMEEFIFAGGVFGTSLNNTKIKNAYKKSRLNNFLEKVFLPRDHMIPSYPVLKKHGWLLPFCHFHRIVKKLFVGNGLKKAKKEIRKNSKVSDEAIEKTAVFLKELGLK